MVAPPLVAVILAVGVQGPEPQPAEIVHRAVRAVELDSVEALRASWRVSARSDPPDLAALLGLATLDRLEYQWRAADSLYEALRHSSRGAAPPGSGSFGIYALLGRAEASFWTGDLVRADSLFEAAARAAELAGDDEALARGLIGLASVRGRSSGGRAADSLLGVAARVVPSTGELAATFRCARAGRMLPDAGIPEARAGIELARAAAATRTEATCAFTVARLWMARGLSDSALAAVRAAAPLYTRSRDRNGRAVLLQWLGWYRRATGEYHGARQDLYEAAIESGATGNTIVQAWATVGLASVALRLGETSSAVRYAGRARQAFEDLADVQGLIVARGIEGDLARAAGDTERAKRAYEDALARTGPVGGASSIGLLAALADVAMIEGRWSEADSLLAGAGRIARASQATGWEAGLGRWRAQLALLAGRLDEAERLYRRQLELPQHAVRAFDSRASLAEIHARSGRPLDAERELIAAFDTLEAWRSWIQEDEFRRYVFGLRESWANPDQGVATVLAVLAESDRVASAFELAERRRARALLDRLGQMGEFASSTGAGGGLGPLRGGERVTLVGVQRALPDDRTALLEYVTGFGGEPTTLFVVTRGRVAAFSLSPVDSLAAAISRFRSFLEADRWLPSVARRLGDQLLGGAIASLPPGVTELVVVPDQGLFQLPFDALAPSGVGLLVERFSVTQAPSAGVAARLWSRGPSLAPRRLLALADARYPDDEAEPATATAAELLDAFRSHGGLPRLRGTRREARSVARIVGDSEVRLRGDASETFLRNGPLSEYRVLHLATHAVADERAVTRTALALSAGERDDGFVLPSDLAALRLDADLVFLSACRTAGGSVIRGEGVQGLSAPLLEAGARSVAATLWAVDDRRVVPLVEDFYRELARGETAASALRAAKDRARLRGDGTSVWSAFTLIGASNARLGPP